MQSKWPGAGYSDHQVGLKLTKKRIPMEFISLDGKSIFIKPNFSINWNKFDSQAAMHFEREEYGEHFFSEMPSV